MGQYTTRHLKGLNVSCDGALNAGGGAFDVYIYGLELLRPNGSALTLDAFDKAWPGKQIRGRLRLIGLLCCEIWGRLGSSVASAVAVSAARGCGQVRR